MPVLKHFTVPETLFFFYAWVKWPNLDWANEIHWVYKKKKKANKQNKKLVSLYFVGVIDIKLIAD